MIASTPPRPDFLRRVSIVHARSLRIRLATLAAGAAFAWLAAIGILAACDFLFEWPWGVRVGALAVASGAVAVGVVTVWLRQRARRNTRRTAADMETAFPGLGQRVRTSVQFGDRTAEDMRHAGVRPELVDALVLETSARSADLSLDDVVPGRRLWAAAGLLLATGLAIVLGSVNWEWRRAMSRTFLADVPYTELTVTPGDVTVQTGAAVGISATLTGRTDREVVLRTRVVDADKKASWTTQSLLADSGTDDDDVRVASFGAGLEGIERSLVYRIEADSLVSPEYRIDVLDPLTIHRVTAEVEYPAYTRLPARTFSDGAISALRGSTCRFTVELSRRPQDVHLTLQELPTKSHPAELAEGISIEGPLVTFTLPVERDLLWTLSATTADGVSLDERPFRIRVTEDRPPKLAFDDPDDGIEVHTLAELPMRARASDDYGLSRSGIVFQISGSEEYTLLEEHFDEVLEAAEDAEESKTIAPRTRSVLERLLPLEHFALTQKDSIMYYAFAEDNHPLEPQRTESDRRFIDIRPLLQTFRRLDLPDGEGGGGGGRLTSLSELIRRERSILNWTIKLSRRGESDDPRDVLSFDRLMRSQAEVADLTRLLAERLQERGVDDVDALYQAEAVMLEAIDSLSVGDLELAELQEKDAQQYLVEGRDRLEIFLSNRPSESIDYQALRDINDMILQRLRRDRDDGERQQAAQLIVAQLMRWARSEEEIAEELGSVNSGAMNSQAVGGAESSDPPEDSEANPSGGEEATPPTDPADTSETENSDEIAGADETTPEESDGPGGTMSDQPADDEQTPVDLEAVEERQFGILAEARELAEIMDGLEDITELAKQRMTDVTDRLETTAQAIEGRDTPTAQAGAAQSARQLRELARQIVGLTQGDVLERIAFSRNLATDLAQRERELADELDAEPEPDSESEEPPTVGMSAGDLAARGQTLEDVLQVIANSTEQSEGEAADRVTVAIEDRDLAGIRERLAEAAEQLEQAGAGMQNEDEPRPETDEERAGSATMAAELRDTADSTERLAADLDQIYRQLLAPVIERLRDLEQRAAELAEQMEQPDNERQGGELAEELEGLIQEMEIAGAGGAAREELEALLQGKGTGNEILWESQAGSDRLRLRGGYRQALRELLEELQLELQELVLTDMDLEAETPIPARYAPFVDRYLKVLSRNE